MGAPSLLGGVTTSAGPCSPQAASGTVRGGRSAPGCSAPSCSAANAASLRRAQQQQPGSPRLTGVIGSTAPLWEPPDDEHGEGVCKQQ